MNAPAVRAAVPPEILSALPLSVFRCVDGIVLREVGHLAQAHPVSALVVGWVGGVVLPHGGRGVLPADVDRKRDKKVNISNALCA